MVLVFPELGIIILCVGSLIFLYLCLLIVKALFTNASGAVSWIPGVGGWLAGKAHDLEHKIVAVFSVAIQGVDDAMGYSLHATARLIDWTGRELERHANLIHMLAVAIPGAGAFIAIRDEINSLRKLLHGTTGTQALSLRHLLDLEKRLAHGIGEDVLPRIRGLEREVDRTIAKDLRGIRAREKSLERGAAGTWKWIRHHPNTIASGAFAGAVAWALGRLGATWLRCNNVRQVGRRVCGMDPSRIEGLLADTLALVGTVSLLEFIRDAQAVEDVALEALGAFIREMPGG